MNNINDGGPAFPIPGLQHDESFNGMTLRDYFAAKAMQGVLSGGDADLSLIDGSRVFEDNLSKISYQIADAMLTARQGGAA